jgi:hypothetical protein
MWTSWQLSVLENKYLQTEQVAAFPTRVYRTPALQIFV